MQEREGGGRGGFVGMMGAGIRTERDRDEKSSMEGEQVRSPAGWVTSLDKYNMLLAQMDVRSGSEADELEVMARKLPLSDLVIMLSMLLAVLCSCFLCCCLAYVIRRRVHACFCCYPVYHNKLASCVCCILEQTCVARVLYYNKLASRVC